MTVAKLRAKSKFSMKEPLSPTAAAAAMSRSAWLWRVLPTLACTVLLGTLVVFTRVVQPLLPEPEPNTARPHGEVGVLRKRSLLPLPWQLRPAFPPAAFAHRCVLVTDHDAPSDTAYPFNARSFCLTSAVCVAPRTHLTPGTLFFAASPSQTRCHTASSALVDTIPRDIHCPALQRAVHCAHGAYNEPMGPICPAVHKLSDAPSNAEWLDGVAIIIPAYHHLGNIFHFAHPAAAAIHIAATLPALTRTWAGVDVPRKVTFLFRGEQPASLGSWQAGVLTALIQHRLRANNVRVDVRTLEETAMLDTASTAQTQSGTAIERAICARSAVFLGQRFDINVWPFASNGAIDPKAPGVPIEAIAFRAAVYAATNVSTRIPPLREGVLSPPPSTTLLDLPPLAVAYARRDNNATTGMTRTFSSDDEAWFVSMLDEESQAAGATFTTVETPEDVSLAQQVRLFRETGFVAGIHGANLMNAMFTPTFGGLLEVFAVPLICYYAGANSGLHYWSYKPVREATPEQSGCASNNIQCQDFPNHRRVMIGEKEDREQLRSLAREGIARLREVHESFKHLDGVPVVYDDTLSEYRIDWSRKA